MTDRKVISIDADQAAGSRFPVSVSDEITQVAWDGAKPAVIATGADAATARVAIDAAGQAERKESELCARMTVRPTRARRILIVNLIQSLMTAGIWTKLDAFHIFAAHDVQTAQLNWVGCSQDLTAVNGPAFQIDRGFSGNGTSAYLDTNVAGNAMEKFKDKDASIGVYPRTPAAANAIDLTVGNGYINPNNSSHLVTLRAGDLTTIANSGGTPSGLFAWTRDANNVTVYQSGTALGSPIAMTAGVSGSATGTFFKQGVAYSSRQLAAGFIGQGLTGAEHGALNTALMAYLTAVGAN